MTDARQQLPGRFASLYRAAVAACTAPDGQDADIAKAELAMETVRAGEWIEQAGKELESEERR